MFGHPNAGVGRPAYDQDMMLTLLMYSYCQGVRASRRIEQLCESDVGYQVICANPRPDHEVASAAVFVDVLALCAAAGLTCLGVIAIDGTKMGADAALDANRGAEAIRAELERILVEAGAPDTAEDAHLGLARGDELPAELASPISRLARLERALAEIEKLEEAAAARGQRPKGRQPAPDQELERAEARLQTARATAATAEPAKAPLANTTDPDSRIMKTPGGCIQGYNVQAAVNEHLTLDEPPTHQRHIRGHGIEAGQHPLLNANVLEGANYHTNHPGAPIQLYLRNSVRYLVDKSRMKGTIVNCKAPHAPSSLNFRPGTSAR